MNTIRFSADDILTHACPTLIKQASPLPLYKHLSSAKKQYPDIAEKAKNFEDIINKNLKKQRATNKISNRSISGILSETSDWKRSIYLTAHLYEHEIDVCELELFLKNILNEINYSIDKLDSNSAVNLRRIIRIYDYLKYGKEKEHQQ